MHPKDTCPDCGTLKDARAALCRPCRFARRTRDAHSDVFVDRFWAKVDRSGGDDACWPWGAGLSRGYGRLTVTRPERRYELAHRFAFYVEHGRFPEPCALHTCDNTRCCNPRHIIEGTQQQNIADCIARGRHTSQRRTV